MEETNAAEHAATTSGDWAGLSGDLLTCIGELLDLPARLCFRCVCRSWSAALPAMPSPWLVIPDGWHLDDRDRFTVLSLPARDRPFRLTLRGQRCIGSSGGWLAFVDVGLSITLLNPLTDAQPAVRLPPLGPLRRGCGSISHAAPMSPDGTLQLRTFQEKRLFSDAQLSFVQRVAFAPNPSEQDYAVAVLCHDDDHGLAFTTAAAAAGGGVGWQWLADWPVAAGRAAPDDEAQYVNRALDLVYHGGKFYYMTLCGTIWALDPAAPPPAAPVPVAKWRPPGPDYLLYGKHLVFTDDGALHVVWSDVPGVPDDARHRPRRMHVRRYDPAAAGRRRWRKARHLGGRAFLIGNRSQSVAVAVPASSSPATWLRPNRVYFTDVTPGSDIFHDLWKYLEPEIWEFDVEADSFRACGLGDMHWLDWHKAIWFTPKGGSRPTSNYSILPFS